MILKSFYVCVTYIVFPSLAQVLDNHLTPSVLPINYNLLIKLDTDTFITDEFQGQVNITLNVSNPCQTIEIYSKNLTNIQVSLAKKGTTLQLSDTVYDTSTDILTIRTTEVLQGLYYLFVRYDGTFVPSGTPGLYKNTYKNQKGEVRFFAATQLVEADARRVFPCFDEPWIKATFDLSVIVPKGFTVLANILQNNVVQQLSNNLEIVTFRITPFMSTHSLAFIVSDFTCSTMNDGILYRVCSRSDFEDQRQYALDVGGKFLNYFENLTGVPYNTSKMNKLDLVAVPDRGGASWGIPTFEESSLLWNDSSDFYKMTVLNSVGEKISAMWFGNLVSVESWSDSYLLESLNGYFKYFAAAEFAPEWELGKQFVIQYLHSSLLEDSYGTTFPLSEEFDGTVFKKGASIIRMMVNIVGAKQFQLAIQDYLQKYMFKSTNSQVFWSLLQNYTNLPHNLNDVVQSWVLQAGYPLVTVTRNGTDVIISQEFFSLFGEKSSTKWYVPITYAVSGAVSSTEIWLTPNYEAMVGSNQIVNESDWIILNNNRFGYYRVNYDDDLWSRIDSVLHNDHTKISQINRAQIIDDLFNLARANRISHSKVLDLISFLANDIDYYSWYEAFDGFANILPRIRNSDVRQKLQDYIKKLMTRVYDSVSLKGEEKHVFNLKQEMVFEWACRLNFSSCVEDARKKFLSCRDGNECPRNLKASVLCYALRQSDYIEQDSYFLWNKFIESNSSSEKVTILSAIGCTPKKTILNKFLQLVTESCTEVQKLESLKLFKSIIANNPDGVDIVLQFLVNNYDRISVYYQDDEIVGTIIKMLGNMFTQESQIDQLLLLVQDKKVSKQVKKQIDSVVILAKNNLKYAEALEKELAEYFSDKEKPLPRKSGSAKISSFCSLLFVIFIITRISD